MSKLSLKEFKEYLYYDLAVGLMTFIEDYGAQEWYFDPYYSATKTFLEFVGKNNLQKECEQEAKKLVEYDDYGTGLDEIYFQYFTAPIKKN